MNSIRLCRVTAQVKMSSSAPTPAGSPVSYVIQEGGQGLHRMVPHVLELCHQLVAQLVVNHRHLEWRRLVGQKVAIVSALKVQLQIWRETKMFSFEHNKQNQKNRFHK